MSGAAAKGLAAMCGGVSVFCILNAVEDWRDRKVFRAVGGSIIGFAFAGAAMFLVTL